MTEDGDPTRLATALARKLNAVRDARMRARMLAEALRDTPATTMVHTLHSLVALNRTAPTPEVGVALEALTTTLSTPEMISYPVRTELYEAAKAHAHDEIARMLFDVSATADDPRGEDPGAERPLTPRGRALTLGERKSLARGHVRHKLEALLRDPHPDVIEILLGNPHVTERDVLVIATKRPTRPDTLAVIAASEKWAKRQPIKRALAFNPQTPAHLTVRIAATLPTADLRAIADDPNLPAPLRAQARSLLAS